MDKQFLKATIVRSVLNGILGWAIFAMVVRVKTPGMTFGQALMIREAILLGIAACVGSFFGYWIRERKQRK